MQTGSLTANFKRDLALSRKLSYFDYSCAKLVFTWSGILNHINNYSCV